MQTQMKSLAIAAVTVAATVAVIVIDPWLFETFKTIAPDWPPMVEVAVALKYVLEPWVVLVAIVIYSFLSPCRRLRRFGILAGLSLSQAILISVLKDFFSRMRPDDLVASFGFFGPQWFDGHSSFPGGHATAAFALATVFSAWHAPWRGTIFAGATIVTLARIYLGRHFFSDCLIGGCIGYWMARAFLRQFWWQPDAADGPNDHVQTASR